MNKENWREKISKLDIESPIAEPLLFKAKLDIGENAYKSLRLRNVAEELWDVGGVGVTGAAIASSPIVAGTFFKAGGIMGLLGLGTAATPLGWIVAAGVLSGAGWFVVRRKLKAMSKSRVKVVPKFINTPLDFLAIAIFDLLAPLALKVAASDRRISEEEHDTILNYFLKSWGYEKEFLDTALQAAAQDIANFEIRRLARNLAKFTAENPDCNFASIKQGTVDFLYEVASADGFLDSREEAEIAKVKEIFESEGSLLTRARRLLHSRLRGKGTEPDVVE
ncbi:MAG: TerB family tellurite resistance protein [Albidovulum sp.]|nr:TerB family tellurite resistance protein [Albidovulum sp.]MDE0533618.1 TerB family tellurite resistance protein [Albidovulum sp.]